MARAIAIWGGSWSVCGVGLCIPHWCSCKHTLVLDSFTAAKHHNAYNVKYHYQYSRVLVNHLTSATYGTGKIFCQNIFLKHRTPYHTFCRSVIIVLNYDFNKICFALLFLIPPRPCVVVHLDSETPDLRFVFQERYPTKPADATPEILAIALHVAHPRHISSRLASLRRCNAIHIYR